MKKLVLIIVSFHLLVNIGVASDVFSLSLSGKYLIPADGNFKNTYKNEILMPEIKANIFVVGNLYLWAGSAISTSNGTSEPELHKSIKFRQIIFSGGPGYRIKIFKFMHLNFEAGIAYINSCETGTFFNEKTEVKSSALGYRAACGFNFFITKSFFAQLNGGFMSAEDNVYENVVKLGGAFGSAGIGIQF